ncbi:MAG TPA: riboflavin synthase [Gemmatimonadales bacterium]
MFTGLVTDVGVLRAVEREGGGRRLRIATGYRRLVIGESIAVAGACLTVSGKGRGWFEVRLVATTLRRTRFGEVRAGDAVNLERALRAGDPLGGHLVQGHVDGVGTVVALRNRSGARLVDIRAPLAVTRASIPLGSITVDGVSLTINALPRPGIIQVSLIPHTLAVTTLSALGVGARVHLEADVIGKYVAGLLKGARELGS